MNRHKRRAAAAQRVIGSGPTAMNEIRTSALRLAGRQPMSKEEATSAMSSMLALLITAKLDVSVQAGVPVHLDDIQRLVRRTLPGDNLAFTNDPLARESSFVLPTWGARFVVMNHPAQVDVSPGPYDAALLRFLGGLFSYSGLEIDDATPRPPDADDLLKDHICGRWVITEALPDRVWVSEATGVIKDALRHWYPAYEISVGMERDCLKVRVLAEDPIDVVIEPTPGTGFWEHSRPNMGREFNLRAEILDPIWHYMRRHRMGAEEWIATELMLRMGIVAGMATA